MIINLSVRGTRGTRKQPVNRIPFAVYVTKVKLVVINIAGTTVKLLRLLAKPIVPSALITIKQANRTQARLSRGTTLPKKGIISRAVVALPLQVHSVKVIISVTVDR